MLRDLRGRTLTFAEHADLAVEVAGGLAELGLGPGSVVAWQLPTSIEAVVLMAACSRLGIVQTPLVPSLRRAEVGFAVEQTAAELLIVPGTWRGFDHRSMADEIAERFGCRTAVVPISDTVATIELPRTGERPTDVAIEPGATDWVFYSSGTTGTPKGVRHTDAGIIAASHTVTRAAQMTSDDVFPIPFPIGHVGGPAMLAAQQRIGFTIVLIEQFDPTTTPLQTADLTILGSAPPFFLAYLDAQASQPDRPVLPRLRVALSGGAPSSVALHRRVRDELGGAGVISVWGMTECPMATASAITDDDDVIADSVGRPTPGVDLRVVDDDGHDVATGEQGELLVRAPQLTVGYTDSLLDRGAFDSAGFLRSGDLGALDAHGVLRVTGRKKDVIIRNAENISAAEVEAHIAKHPAVVDVAVVGLPDPATGERCCALVVLRPDAPPVDVAALATFCRELGLAAYKAPERVEIVPSLPRDALGKVAKHRLRADLLAAGRAGTESPGAPR
ncbi:MAG: AMP-binding protein [Actinobacteria bacterium]|nr:AMP-binding protein [Actinomycetota bacterium]